MTYNENITFIVTVIRYLHFKKPRELAVSSRRATISHPPVHCTQPPIPLTKPTIPSNQATHPSELSQPSPPLNYPSLLNYHGSKLPSFAPSWIQTLICVATVDRNDWTSVGDPWHYLWLMDPKNIFFLILSYNLPSGTLSSVLKIQYFAKI
jgi:hypothetical protein